VSLEACPSTADTTGIDAPLPIMATASAPRRECIPQTWPRGNVIPARAACRDSREATDEAPPNAPKGWRCLTNTFGQAVSGRPPRT